MGNWDMPFLTCGEFKIPTFVALPLVVGIFPSLPLLLKGLGHFPEDRFYPQGNAHFSAEECSFLRREMVISLRGFGPIPLGGGEGTGKFLPRVAKPRVVGILNSPQVTKGTSQFPTHGLAGVVES